MSAIHQSYNHRPNHQRVSLCGSPLPHKGQVIADLYLDGKFVRSAVVADCGDVVRAQKYCDILNAKNGPAPLSQPM